MGELQSSELDVMAEISIRCQQRHTMIAAGLGDEVIALLFLPNLALETILTLFCLPT